MAKRIKIVLGRMSSHKCFTKSFTAIFNQVESQFESLGTAIVGVGHGGWLVATQIVGEQDDFAPHLAFTLCKAFETVQVVVVHGHDKVEAVEVVHTNGPRAMGEPIAPGRGVLAHTAVGVFAFVIVNHTG